MPKRKPAKPSVKLIRRRIADTIETILRAEVRPYLQHLIDTAQAKTQYNLSFCMAMGVTCVYCDGAPWQQGAWETVEEAVSAFPHRDYGIRIKRLKRKFPELVEFMKIVCGLDRDVFCEDVQPSVLPRKADDTQDPADFVEEGPIRKCEVRKCEFRGVDAEFIWCVETRRYLCPDCINGRGPYRAEEARKTEAQDAPAGALTARP